MTYAQLLGVGFDQACASILSQRIGRDVYIVGAANVGKSAFVRRMLKEMANMTSRHFDAKATQVGRRLPVESAMPGTTLGFVKLGAFSSGGALYDTPGTSALVERVTGQPLPKSEPKCPFSVGPADMSFSGIGTCHNLCSRCRFAFAPPFPTHFDTPRAEGYPPKAEATTVRGCFSRSSG